MTYQKLFLRALQALAPFRKTAVSLVCVNALIGLLSLVEPIILGKMIDAFSTVVSADGSEFSSVIPLFLLWTGLGAATVAISFFAGLSADKMAQRLRIRSIEEYTKQALNLPISYHERNPPAYAFQTLLDGSNTFWILCFSFFRDNCASFALLIMLCPTLLILNWRLAIPLIALALAVYVLFATALFFAEKAQINVDIKNNRILAHVADVLSHLKLVNAFDASASELRRLRELQSGYLKDQEPLLAFWAAIVTASRAASLLSILVVFGAGLWLMTKDMTTIGEVVSFAFIAQIAIGRLDAVSVFLSTVFQQKPKLERFFELLDAKTNADHAVIDVNKKPFKAAVSFENVSFQYPNGNVALQNVSFQLEPGTMTALVGKSGSGKTTILSLLCRFYEPTHGLIRAGGEPLNSLSLRTLRKRVAVMFQDPMILSRSFESNVRFGSEAARWSEVEKAMQATSIYDLYLRDKDLGGSEDSSDGIIVGLSGGERQRLSLARVILRDAPIVLLDEPTSAADSVTEAAIQSSLDEVLRGKTSLIIAHRLSTVQRADQIIVLDRGRVVEVGSYDDLHDQGGLFSELLEQHFHLGQANTKPRQNS